MSGNIALALLGINIGAPIVAAQAQKRAADFNAAIAEQKARVALDQGNANEEAQRRRAALALGEQTAGAVQSGGLSGTNADLIAQSATMAEIDALNIRYGAKLNALGQTEQAQLDRMQGRDAMTAGYMNAAAAALSAGGNYGQGQARVRGARGGLS